ncbi:hypothetical protein JIN85_18500 [Luteolibacter pohnpeiensis]|uniref:Uncharacterized protein n=1 Tax=Luteolibacter pohnpeiensis TaxID=454153 RepID=A0A934SAQ7_9BACT|nr:hypothetical protein [Luteolibacter pohnpeiensis]MBK1884414.1 hypothetical protein [Luteolibacter pohnpeiensis]
MKFITLGVFIPTLVFAEVEPPTTWQLNPSKVLTIPIHTEMDTLLMFPQPVTLIAGKGLTQGDGIGIVQYQQAQDARIILLRQIKQEPPVLMHVVMGTEGYSFQLVGSSQPASIIHFKSGEQTAPAVEIPEADARGASGHVDEERQAQLVRLFLGEAVLKAKIPEEYQGYRSVQSNVSTRTGNIEIRVSRVGRFDREDAIVLLAEIRGLSENNPYLSEKGLKITLAENRSYQPNYVKISKDDSSDSGVMKLTLLLIGDGKGSSLHLSPENRFGVTLDQNLSLKPNP